MKPKFLLLATLAMLSTVVQARDVHGENGYYKYTAAQLQQDGILRVDGNTGNKDKNWLPAVNFADGYVESVLGVGDAAKNWWRTTAYLNYRAQDQNLKITKNYPVVAMKFSLPKNVDEQKINITVEYWWKNPYEGTNGLMVNKNGLGLNGVSSGGRFDYAEMYRGKKITATNAGLMEGRDSCKLGGDNKYSNWLSNQEEGISYFMRSGNYGTAAAKDTSFVIMRLPDTAPEKEEFVVLMNYYSIADNSDEAKESKRLLDRTDIESVGYHIMFFGYSNIEEAKEAPKAYIKWMKTFSSLGDAIGQITLANGYGDGPFTYDVTSRDSHTAWCEYDNQTKNVTIANRGTLWGKEWNMICLPFELSADAYKKAFGEDVKVAEFKGVTKSNGGDVVSFNLAYINENNSMEAATPYLIMPSKDIPMDDITFKNVKASTKTTAEQAAGDGGYKLIGTLEPTPLTKGHCQIVLGRNNQLKFMAPNATTPMQACRAYFEVEDGDVTAAKSFQFSLDGETTAIDMQHVDASMSSGTKVYNLNGQIVGTSIESLPQGIYVVGGKKIVR